MYYHGTASTLLPDILKNGLEYVAANRWHIVLISTRDGREHPIYPGEGDQPGYVYVTDNWQNALNYATNRAAFLNTLPRKPFNWAIYDSVHGIDPEYISPAGKTGGLYLPGSKPVVLSVEVSGLTLEQDQNDEYAYMIKSRVVPSRLKVVWEGKWDKAA